MADAVVDTLYQRTAGNPLFVGEVINSVSPEELGQNQDTQEILNKLEEQIQGQKEQIIQVELKV